MKIKRWISTPATASYIEDAKFWLKLQKKVGTIRINVSAPAV